MSKKEKNNVLMKRLHRFLINARKNPGKYICRMTGAIIIFLVILLLAVIGGAFVNSQNTKEVKTDTQEVKTDTQVLIGKVKDLEDDMGKVKRGIEVIMSAQQEKDMISNNGERDSGSSIDRKKFMDPVEVDGKLLSGYAVVSFDTSDGPYALYDGYFENGLFNGQGFYTTYYSGTGTVESIYDGEWKDSRANGIGTYKFFYKESGKMRLLTSGNMKDGLLDGSACEYTKFSSDGGIIFKYSGDFSEGEFNGSGKRFDYTKDGQVLQSVCEGIWKNNYLNGEGTLTGYYEDGETIKYIYDGTWKDNRQDGEGTATGYYENGTKMKWQYNTLWKAGFPDGDGKFIKYDKNESILTTGTTTRVTDGNNVEISIKSADESVLKEFRGFLDEVVEGGGSIL